MNNLTVNIPKDAADFVDRFKKLMAAAIDRKVWSDGGMFGLDYWVKGDTAPGPLERAKSVPAAPLAFPCPTCGTFVQEFRPCPNCPVVDDRPKRALPSGYEKMKDATYRVARRLPEEHLLLSAYNGVNRDTEFDLEMPFPWFTVKDDELADRGAGDLACLIARRAAAALRDHAAAFLKLADCLEGKA